LLRAWVGVPWRAHPIRGATPSTVEWWCSWIVVRFRGVHAWERAEGGGGWDWRENPDVVMLFGEGECGMGKYSTHCCNGGGENRSMGSREEVAVANEPWQICICFIAVFVPVPFLFMLGTVPVQYDTTCWCLWEW
jgi:hypothetical protein